MTIRAIRIGAQLWKRAKKKAAATDITLPFCGFLRPWKSIAGVILGTTCANPVFRAELHPYLAFGPWPCNCIALIKEYLFTDSNPHP